MNDRSPVIVFAVFPGATQLDFTGPYHVLSRLEAATVILAGSDGGMIEADGIIFAGVRRLADIANCDMICVPGGAGVTDNAIHDDVFLGELRRLAAGASYVTSVCTGSVALAAAGLLRGRRATCHWLWRDSLSVFGAIPVAGRVVRDGNVVTAAGVTSGIDFALTIAADLAGPEAAQAIQLQMEYAPEPPFNAGDPETAPASVRERVRELNAPAAARRRAAIEAAAARLGF